MFRPPVVAILRVMYFEGLLHGKLQQLVKLLQRHNWWPKHVAG